MRFASAPRAGSSTHALAHNGDFTDSSSSRQQADRRHCSWGQSARPDSRGGSPTPRHRRPNRRRKRHAPPRLRESAFWFRRRRTPRRRVPGPVVLHDRSTARGRSPRPSPICTRGMSTRCACATFTSASAHRICRLADIPGCRSSAQSVCLASRACTSMARRGSAPLIREPGRSEDGSIELHQRAVWRLGLPELTGAGVDLNSNPSRA